MQQLYEPYKIRYTVLGGLGEGGASSMDIVQAHKAPRVLLPLVVVPVCVCVSFLGCG